MKLDAVKKKVGEYQYFENTDVIDVALASIVATRLEVSEPIWLSIIGPSSGGKTQIIRPMCMTDKTYMHSVDDLSVNTLLSSAKGGEAIHKEKSASLLHRIGKRGIIVFSDLTILFSKSKDDKTAILGQFRGLYDGHMTKLSGTSAIPNTWTGKVGVIAGGTQAIYRSFEEVSEMGERFIYYRMKPFDEKVATRIAIRRKKSGKAMNEALAGLYGGYITNVVKYIDTFSLQDKLEISDEVLDHIIDIASLAERMRTSSVKDWKGESVIAIPAPAMIMRVSQQLEAVAQGLMAIRLYESDGKSAKLRQEDLNMIDWCAWSMGNEEKRAVLNVFAKDDVSTQSHSIGKISEHVGLAEHVIEGIVQSLCSVGILKKRSTAGGGTNYCMGSTDDYKIIRRIYEVDTGLNTDITTHGSNNRIVVEDSDNDGDF